MTENPFSTSEEFDTSFWNALLRRKDQFKAAVSKFKATESILSTWQPLFKTENVDIAEKCRKSVVGKRDEPFYWLLIVVGVSQLTQAVKKKDDESADKQSKILNAGKFFSDRNMEVPAGVAKWQQSEAKAGVGADAPAPSPA